MTQPDGYPDINVVLAAYMRRYEVAALDSYPLIWAGHYGGGLSLGEYSTPLLPGGLTVAQVGLGMMAPFGMSPEVTASYLVVDSFRADPFCDQPLLHISGLVEVNERSVLRSHWVVPVFEIRDIARRHGEAVNVPTPYEGLDKALSDITERRQHGDVTYSFSDAYGGSLHILRSLLA